MATRTEKETLEYVAELAVKAAGAQNRTAILKVAGESEFRYGIVRDTGEIAWRIADPPPRAHQLAELSDLPTFIDNVKGTLEGSPTVWLSPEAVEIVLLDGIDRNTLGTARLTLRPTPQFAALAALEKSPQRLRQKPFLQWLRVTLFDALQETAEGRQLYTGCKAIDFRSNASGKATVEFGRESLGREIQSEVISAAGGIPEFVPLPVRVYDDPRCPKPVLVRCAVDVDPNDACGAPTFALLPLAGECDRLRRETLTDVRDWLRNEVDEELPIYFGKP